MIVRPESATAWELRAASGAFAIVDGWHVPMGDVLAVHAPHHHQRAA